MFHALNCILWVTHEYRDRHFLGSWRYYTVFLLLYYWQSYRIIELCWCLRRLFRHMKIKSIYTGLYIRLKSILSKQIFFDRKWMEDTLWVSYIHFLSKIFFFLWKNELKAFPMGVLHSFSIKNNFYAKMNWRLFLWGSYILFLLKTFFMKTFFMKKWT